MWEFFTVCDDPTKAKCKCNAIYSRGKTPKTYSTKSLLDHIKKKHQHEYADLRQREEKDKPDEPSSSCANMMDLTTAASTQRQAICQKQPTIVDTFEKCKQFGANHPTQIKLNHELMEWLIDGMLPYSTVENECFKKFVHTLCPRYKLSSEKYLRTCLMPNMYSKVKKEVIRIIHEHVDYCSVTTDMWSSAAMDAYMSVTVDFILEAWNKKSMVLECLPFKENHTSQNLIKALQSAFLEYGIENSIHAIVPDNAANIVKATNEGGWKNVGCFLHGLHLVVTNSMKCQYAVVDLLAKVRIVVRAFHHSTKAKTLLKAAQEKENLPNHKLILDQETRWSSTYQMLDRFLLQKKAIILASLEMEKLPRLLEVYEWKMLQSLVELLKGIANVVTYCEKESACISEAIPGIKSLKKMLSSNDYYGVNTLKEELLENIQKYFYGNDRRDHFISIEENELYTIATLLDPRFKKKGFLSEGAADHAELLLTKMVADEIKKGDLSKRLASNPDKSVNTSPKRRKMDDTMQKRSGACAFAYFDDSASSEDGSQEDDENLDEYARAKIAITTYLQEPRSRFSDSPLLFWHSSYARYPELANLARRYL